MAEASIEELATAAAAAPAPHRELTVPSLIAAVIVAAVMGAAYPYIVLKLGFGPNVSVVSAFFGFAILSLIARGSYDRFQNNIVQTAGTSGAQTAFMCGVLASFDMLRTSKIVSFHLDPTPLQVFVWLTCASLLGVLLAVPMRRHFIVDEKLPFPDGTAAAETVMVLDPPSRTGPDDAEWRKARRAAMVLGVGLAASGLLMLVRKDVPLFGWIPEGWDPGALTLGAAGAGFVVATMGVGVSYSLLSIGSGFLIGQRVNTWMLVGGVLGWIVAPLLLMRYGVLHDHPKRLDVLYWVMWPGVGMMLAGGITALVLRWRLLVAGDAGAARRRGRRERVSAGLGGRRHRGAVDRALRHPVRLLRAAGVDDADRHLLRAAADAGRPARPRRNQLGPDRRALQRLAGPLRGDRARQRQRQHPRQRPDRLGRGDLRGADAGLQGRLPDRLDAALDDHRPADRRADRRGGAVGRRTPRW